MQYDAIGRFLQNLAKALAHVATISQPARYPNLAKLTRRQRKSSPLFLRLYRYQARLDCSQLISGLLEETPGTRSIPSLRLSTSIVLVVVQTSPACFSGT